MLFVFGWKANKVGVGVFVLFGSLLLLSAGILSFESSLLFGVHFPLSLLSPSFTLRWTSCFPLLQLRLRKVSELIHNSVNYQDLEYARVSVYFQDIVDTGPETFNLIEGTELCITRQANRDNTSGYYVNGKKTEMKKVQEVLKAKGVDLSNNRFLILQGEVESISQMKPKGKDENDTGLLEYLEEIIGTNQYVEPIEELGKRLEDAGERRGMVLKRVRHAETELQALEGGKREAETFLHKDVELKRWNAIHCHLNLRLIANNLARVGETQTQLQERLAHETEKSQSYEAAYKEAEVACSALETTFKQAAADADAVARSFHQFEKADVKNREEIKGLKVKKKTAQGKLNKVQQKSESLSREVTRCQEEIPATETKILHLEAQLEQDEKKLITLTEESREEIQITKQRLVNVEEQLGPFQTESTELNGDLMVARDELEVLSTKKAQLAEREGELTRQRDAARTELITKRKASDTLASELIKATETVETIKQRLAALTEEDKTLQLKVRDVRAKVEERMARLNDNSGRAKTLRVLDQLRRTGRVKGISGRLGDLGHIADEYDVAINTACSGLDWIIVDRAETAQACIEHLRRENAGVATFMTLDKCQQYRAACAEQGKISTPENVPRLFDLVQVADQTYLPAFYAALRDCLVCRDLEQASRITYHPSNQRFRRAVTLAGELIADSGAMTGGGAKPQGGKMRLASSLSDSSSSSSFQAKEKQKKKRGGGHGMDVDGAEDQEEDSVRASEVEMERMQKRILALRGEMDGLQSELRQAQSLVRSLSMQAPKAKMDVQALEASLEAVEQQLRELNTKEAEEERKSDGKRVKELEREVKRLEEQLSKMTEANAGLLAEAEGLQKQLDNVGGGSVRRQRDRVDNLRKDIDELRASVIKKSAAVASLEKQADKAAKETAKIETELAEVEAELAKKEEEKNEIETKAMVVLQEMNAAKDLKIRMEEDLTDARADLDAKDKDLGTIKRVIVELRGKLEELEEKKKDEARKQRHWTKELAKHRAARQEALQALKQIAGIDLMAATKKDDEEDEVEKKNDDEDAMEGVEAAAAEGTESNGTKQSSEVEGDEEDEESLGKYDLDSVSYKIVQLEDDLAKLSPDMGAIEAFRRRESDYRDKIAELEGITVERDGIRVEFDRLRKLRLDEFMSGFNIISLKLKEMYQMITLGGDAELELVDSCDPFSEGIVFSVRPPKKSWKNIANLSGGEKTLSSLALVFALHQYKPTPLYVMDEIDAALDFKNVSIVGHYIKERTKDAQFVIISLRNNMFELADRLVGIYKTENATKSVTIDPRAFTVGAHAKVVPSNEVESSSSRLATAAPTNA